MSSLLQKLKINIQAIKREIFKILLTKQKIAEK